ncbi:hypothetical protein SAMN04487846_0762 [Microbacterium sp. cf046]|uniref:hypothetical protein n=1 Tax=Microbacterium sp. cf046 TaxID=1761803 RepID=UPI0008E0E294|nr:hypothetical protein [Microbacterium sp. cf046]SFR93184.1 hypothetical protein SAMN04487846_0762 [Microbacterium sp. cf046]
MKTIITTSGDFLTGTEIADAVTAYALALARVRALDVVDIPFVAEDGSFQRAQFRIGWHERTAVTTEGRTVEELMEIDTTLELHAKSRSTALGRDAGVRGRPADSRQDTNWDEII